VLAVCTATFPPDVCSTAITGDVSNAEHTVDICANEGGAADAAQDTAEASRAAISPDGVTSSANDDIFSGAALVADGVINTSTHSADAARMTFFPEDVFSVTVHPHDAPGAVRAAVSVSDTATADGDFLKWAGTVRTAFLHSDVNYAVCTDSVTCAKCTVGSRNNPGDDPGVTAGMPEAARSTFPHKDVISTDANSGSAPGALRAAAVVSDVATAKGDLPELTQTALAAFLNRELCHQRQLCSLCRTHGRFAQYCTSRHRRYSRNSHRRAHDLFPRRPVFCHCSSS
jgi:hypothetical protein